MKDYLTIHINKRILESIGKSILIIGLIILFIFMSYCTIGYTFEGSYHDGYNALAKEIKDAMNITECGHYSILFMEEFKIKLYQEPCLFNNYYEKAPENLAINWEFVNSEVKE